MKKILGLDLGTNSIGWALVDKEEEKIIALGGRIVPMGAEVIEFEKGNPQTKNAERRNARSIRRMGKRYKNRRNKLIYILERMGLLPDQFEFNQPFSDPTKIQKINLLPVKKGSNQISAPEFFQLKCKALTNTIDLKDLGKLLFNYNQLRGYAGGGEEDADEIEDNKQEEDAESDILKYEKLVKSCKIVSNPKKLESKRKGKEIYEVEISFEEEMIKGETLLNTIKQGDELELQIIIRRNKKGETTSVNFSIPLKTNWRKSMEELEEELDKLTQQKGSEAFLCEYFLAKLQENSNYKVRSKVVLRKRYQVEFDAIWDAQYKLNPSFKKIVDDKSLLNEISSFIFPGKNPQKSQATLRETAQKEGLKHLIRNQVIYYQRDLKDQSELIGKCRYEKTEPVAPKSHPVFQEFKIWEQINKLSVNTRTQVGTKKNGESKFEYADVPLDASYKQWLFDELQKKKEVSAKAVYSKLEKDGVIVKHQSFLNGIRIDGKLKGNDTLLMLKKSLGEWFDKFNLHELQNLIEFWNLLYYGKGNEYDLDSPRCQAIKNYIIKTCGQQDQLDKLTIRFAKIKFARTYGSLSLIAINNMLSLMRAGKYFNTTLPQAIHDNIVIIVNEIHDDPFLKSAQEVLEKYHQQFLISGGMQSSYAAIVVYGKHTAESFDGKSVTKPSDISQLPQGDLRNPLAEQMINETLKVVKDIWQTHKIKPNEIRIELARELKNSADERNKIAKANDNNRKINERVKQRLIELNKETSLGNIERYRLWSMQATEPYPYPESAKEPTKSEIEKMRLWEEQKCVSPYTGQPIPLSKLFDKGLYDIDHIIPKSRYFDDSMTNKVVCERNVNIDKGNRTAWEYFEVGSVEINNLLSKENFINHVNQNFFGRKRKILLATKIPQDPIARQLKDTQYIAVKVREELSKIVGSDNVKTSTGGVTDYLRHHWGVHDKFKEITQARYNAALALIKDDEKRNNTKWSKRIDHRHQAIDGLIVACTDQAHIQRLNNLNKELQDWLRKNQSKILDGFQGNDDELIEAFVNLPNEKRDKLLEELKGFRNFDQPWKGFTDDAKKAIQQIIVSHKPKEKLLIQKVQKGPDAGVKDMLRIRGKLHDATLYGLSSGKEAYKIKLSKLAGKQFATEKTIEKIIDPKIKEEIKNHLLKYKGNKAEAFSAEGINDFNNDRKIPIYGFKIYYKDQAEKYNLTKLGTKKSGLDLWNDILDRMIDENIKTQLIAHFEKFGGSLQEAFSKKGIEEFNKNFPKPIKAIRLKTTDTQDEEEINLSLLPLTRKSSYNNKLMIATGSNYAFAVLEKNGKRHFDEITFFHATKIVNEQFKIGNTNVKEIVDNYFKNRNPASTLLFTLKQDDTVYLPSESEQVITNASNPEFEKFWNDKINRAPNVYTVVKFSGKTIYFLKHDVAKVVANKIEFGSQNCYEKVNGVSIKDHCIKLSVDRLGNIKPA